MGNVDCCSGNDDDTFSKLKVTVLDVKNCPLDDVYIQLKYGPSVAKNEKGSTRNDKITKTRAVKTQGQLAEFSETLFMNTPALRAKYSMEIKAFDNDAFPSNYIGKGRVEYAFHGANNETTQRDRQENLHHSHDFSNKDAQHFLPCCWFEENTYTVQLRKDDAQEVGIIMFKCQFIPGKYHKNDTQNFHRHQSNPLSTNAAGTSKGYTKDSYQKL